MIHSEIRKDFSVVSKEKCISITSNLVITDVVYGLGLNEEGSNKLVSTTLEEHNVVITCAFQSFTQNEDSHNIGMVYGIESVPLVDNKVFHAASKVLAKEVDIELTRSLHHEVVHYSKPTSVWLWKKR